MSTDSPLKRMVALRDDSAWLQSTIEAHMVNTPRERHEPEPGWFHPSSLGHLCDAYLAFQFLGVEEREKISPRLQRIFDLGSSRDSDIKAYINAAGLSVINHPGERKISLPDYRIRGEFDERVRHPVGSETYIVEIKTMNDEEWQKLKEPKTDHKYQVHPYMVATGDDKTIFVYENKNTQDWKTFLQRVDWPLWGGITGRLKAIVDGLAQGYVHRHPVPFEPSCPFYWMCSSANIPQLVKESGLQL